MEEQYLKDYKVLIYGELTCPSPRPEPARRLAGGGAPGLVGSLIYFEPHLRPRVMGDIPTPLCDNSTRNCVSLVPSITYTSNVAGMP